jgi:hypothetical protein
LAQGRFDGRGAKRIFFENEKMALAAAQDLAAGNNTRPTPKADIAPTNWATTNAGASIGRMPENVFVRDRAIVIAGFANDVDAVNR